MGRGTKAHKAPNHISKMVLSTVHFGPPLPTVFIAPPRSATSAASAPPMGLSPGLTAPVLGVETEA